MGHPGKHTIDPETGLCEICDQGAIQEIHRGRKPAKKVYYSDQDGVPHGKDRYVYEVVDESQPRYVRKVVYPPPTVRPRRVVYEQPIEKPIVVQQKIIRRELTPPQDVIIRRPAFRPKAYYYVDNEGQMVPRTNTPPSEPPRRYVVRTKENLPPPPPPPARTVRVVRRQIQTPPSPPPPARTVRVVHRQIQTPPPPATEVWHTGPRRQTNSDTEIIDRQQRKRREETTYTPPIQIRPELYHLEGDPDENRYSPVDPPMYPSREYRTPSPRIIEKNDKNQRSNRVEPLPQKTNRPTPTVVRRVYEKLPPGKQQPERKSVRNLRSTKQSQLSNERVPSPESGKNPAIYYIRSVDNYD